MAFCISEFKITLAITSIRKHDLIVDIVRKCLTPNSQL